jgi:hypothetical protein
MERFMSERRIRSMSSGYYQIDGEMRLLSL